MWSTTRPSLLVALLGASHHVVAQSSVDLSWHAPNATDINNLTEVLQGSGTYGFIFTSSDTPNKEYGTYNWCNMPHTRSREYPKAPAGYELKYVELIHRHHKRTPYSSNSFPVESYHWDCNDQGLYYYGQPLNAQPASAHSYWQGYISPVNPFVPSGWLGTCQFPQITTGGLDDSYQHGQDLYGVYHDLLGFLPARWDPSWRQKVTYRVTQNVITSQVAGMVISGMWGTTSDVPLIIEASGVDSLEPAYTCNQGNTLFNNIKSSSTWNQHLTDAAPLYSVLDDISGVSPSDSGFHASFDHYYDNLSARQCHAKPLPCKLANGVNSTTCVTQTIADSVYRMGQWEYSQIYRGDSASLGASASTFGVWIGELTTHLRDVMAGKSKTLWYHNVAHDGSVSRLLSVLQIDVMVWPGMGSEVVFELYQKKGGSGKSTSQSGYYMRVLWSGQVLRSSNPSLGLMNMVPVETVLAYFDGLVGEGASLVLGKCN